MRLLDVIDRLEREYADRKLHKEITGIEHFIQQNARVEASSDFPVIFFNASTRIHTLSINAAISLIASWAILLAGIPVKYLVCQWGMQQCILGTNKDNPEQAPPCKHCVKHSQILFPGDRVLPIQLDRLIVQGIKERINSYSLDELMTWTYETVPLGELCLPGLRWALRRHSLIDDVATRKIYTQYLASAASLVHQFNDLFDKTKPRALVIFNGLTFPEAIARHLADMRHIPVVTHEVGLRPYSAFFSHKDATFRELSLSANFQLSAEDEQHLDTYLNDRFQGKYTMAGIRFWPEMTPLPEEIKQRIQQHDQTVSIFTNVIFDTSQVHANTIFEDMFAWLDDLRNIICKHPQTLFVIRAHPDEDRPGKESNQSVANWVEASGVGELENVDFIGPSETVSSYELIRLSKVVLVYNSSIGLEAAIMGAAVLCAGRARYTQIPTVFFPENRIEYLRKLNELLEEEIIEVPKSFGVNAKRFLFYELYRASLDLSDFLRPYPRAKGMTLFQEFDPELLSTSESLKAIRKGILENGSFII